MEWRLEADPNEDPLHPNYSPEPRDRHDPFFTTFKALASRARSGPTRESYLVTEDVIGGPLDRWLWRDA